MPSRKTDASTWNVLQRASSHLGGTNVEAKGAPYEDELSDDGTELIYEGHDAPKSASVLYPKSLDQPWSTVMGSPTENAKFARGCEPGAGNKALVRVYEKLLAGVWSDKGLFELAGYEYRKIGSRKVFKFHMHLVAERETPGGIHADLDHRRLIPGWVKLAVFRRDKGQCVKCGARDNLHFDHDLPFSKGGASITPDNVKLLCARHNLEKGARIE